MKNAGARCPRRRFIGRQERLVECEFSPSAKAMQERSFVFCPVNAEQRRAVALFRASDVLLLVGPAGSGKTHVALGLALGELSAGKCRKVVLTRPTVECGESLGFLPGELEDKYQPWLGPFADVLGNMVHKPAELLASKQVEIAPLAYLRGRTIDHAIGILDEAQNCTLPQLRMYLSRIGAGGKLILAGDPDQADIRSGFRRALEALADLPGVGVATLQSQCVRHPLIPEILRRLA